MQRCTILKRPPPTLRCTGFKALDEKRRIELISKLATPLASTDDDTKAVRNYIERKLTSAINDYKTKDGSKLSANGKEIIKENFITKENENFRNRCRYYSK